MTKNSGNSPHINRFRKLRELGYSALPVAPPTAHIRNAGKRPAVIDKDTGQWSGRAANSFLNSPPDADSVWESWHGSVGISCNGTGILAIDGDILSVRWADRVAAICMEVLGAAPKRIGRAPKFLLVYACDPGMRYAQLRFDDERPRPAGEKVKPAMVEVLAGDSKWFVADGIHPDTKKPYTWSAGGLPPRDQLTRVTAEQIEILLARLALELPKAVRPGAGGTGEGPIPPTERLRGDPRLVAEAMQHVPNDVESVDYHAWARMAVALNGALGPENHALGLELFEAWTEKSGVAAPTERADRVYDSFDLSRIRLGADYIYAAAEAAGWQGIAAVWFDPMPQDEPAEDLLPYGGEDAPVEAFRFSAYGNVVPGTIPLRDFLYGAHIVRRFVSMTVAPSKVGKSSLATVDVLAMVTGRTLIPGMTPSGKLRVAMLNGEDPLDELQRRVEAAKMRYGITAADIGDRLFLDSGRTLRLVTVVEERGNITVLRPVVDATIAALREQQIDVLEVDPFVSSHRVRENDNTGIEAVVAEWIRVADEANCAVEFVHHARKAAAGGEVDETIDSARGASAMIAKMRSVRALARMTKGQAERLHLTSSFRSLFRITDAASNLAPWVSDDTQWLKLESVDLGNGLATEGTEEAGWHPGDQVAVVVPWSAVSDVTVEGSDRDAVISFMGAEEYREDVQARDEWIGFAVAAALKLDPSDVEDKARVKRLVAAWLKDGTLVRVRRADKRRIKRWYVRAGSVLD